MGVAPPPNLDQISKTTPLSDLLSYKGCLSVERNIRRRQKNSVVKYVRLHYVWAEVACNYTEHITALRILEFARTEGATPGRNFSDSGSSGPRLDESVPYDTEMLN